MTSLHKRSVFLCIIFVIIDYTNGNCNKKFNFRNCAYDIKCETDFSNTFYDMQSFIYSNRNTDEASQYEDNVNFDSTTSCNLLTSVPNWENYRQFYPVHLHFRRIYSLNDISYIPYCPNNCRIDQIINIITNLDLSSNEYEYIPKIAQIINLAHLDVSKNLLAIADLSNSENLYSLTEIDLSHNFITDIAYTSTYEYKTLKKIDLSFNRLTVISESMFGPLHELEILDVSHNLIDILSPITFEGMKQMKHLNISFNRISDINASLFRFTELKSLLLSNNNIQIIKATDFDKLINLLVLDLSGNLISTVDKGAFDFMPLLENLNLKSNKIVDFDKHIFDNVTQLTDIDLSENSIKNIPKNLFKGKNIQKFSVKDNHLEGSLDKGVFEGLSQVTILDLSYQNLESVSDYAFYGLGNLFELLLNNNNIRLLSQQSFKTLNSLKRLDLSNNKIQNIECEKTNLYNLFFLSLKNNLLTVVKKEDFHGLNSLQFLDLSDNKITQLESHSFESLKELTNIQLSNNPLRGTLQNQTFDGLSSLPSLDISCTLLSNIQNGSFIGMTQLKNLNASHSKINTLEYNIFIQTGHIEVIDLSFNEIQEFNINSSELTYLNTLYLNNNLIKKVDSLIFLNVLKLSKLSLSQNKIQNLNAVVFNNLKNLRMLDVSYNPDINVTLELLNNTKTIDILDLSGLKTNISFGPIKDITLKQLVISNSGVLNVATLQLNELRYLDSLILSHNKISKLNVGSFSNISSLKVLDLSFNKISFIQPRVFADNTMLETLNVSHNQLNNLPYGVLSGLIHLNTLDISYNHIGDLQNERFYEVKSLDVLIADHNKIESISADDFTGTSLTRLSIGGNPIPCEVLVNIIKREGIRNAFEITASNLYENNDENVNGVTCNKKNYNFNHITSTNSSNESDNVKVLLNIRDIMIEHFKNYENNKDKDTTDTDDSQFLNITNQIQTSNAELTKMITELINSSTHTRVTNNETNNLLAKILRVLTLNSATRTPPVQVTKDNATYENLLSYINKVKQELDDTLKLDKESIKESLMTDIDAKIATMKSERETLRNEFNAKLASVNSLGNEKRNLITSEIPRHEKLRATSDSSSLFTATCVALILVIIVGFLLFKVYKSGVFVRQRFSVSTRELPGSMDSPL